MKRDSLLSPMDIVFFKKDLICVVEQKEQLELCITKQNKEDRRYIDIKGKTLKKYKQYTNVKANLIS